MNLIFCHIMWLAVYVCAFYLGKRWQQRRQADGGSVMFWEVLFWETLDQGVSFRNVSYIQC